MGDLIDVLIRREREPKLRPGPGLSPRPELWFCPSPGTPDWRALADPATFAMLAKDCDALQLYQGQLQEFPLPPGPIPRTALPPHGWNTWRAFKEWGILSMAAAHRLPVIVECAGLKEWSDDVEVYVNQILEAIRRGKDLGGNIPAVSLDEPWTAGFYIRQAPWSFEQVLAHLEEVRRRVHDAESGVSIGLIEAYPAHTVDVLCNAVQRFAPAFLHLDIDYRFARQQGSPARVQADLVKLAECCRSARVPFGVIIWGYEEDTAETFIRSALRLLAVIQHAVLRGDLTWPDRLIVQSWSATAVLGPRLIPPTLPPDGETSLWGLLRTVKRAL